MHIRTYIRRLEKFLQQRFNKKLNISLFVSRRSKYAHLDLDILLLSTRVYSEFSLIMYAVLMNKFIIFSCNKYDI